MLRQIPWGHGKGPKVMEEPNPLRPWEGPKSNGRVLPYEAMGRGQKYMEVLPHGPMGRDQKSWKCPTPWSHENGPKVTEESNFLEPWEGAKKTWKSYPMGPWEGAKSHGSVQLPEAMRRGLKLQKSPTPWSHGKGPKVMEESNPLEPWEGPKVTEQSNPWGHGKEPKVVEQSNPLVSWEGAISHRKHGNLKWHAMDCVIQVFIYCINL